MIGGTFDWLYEHLGMFSWVVEIWSPMREAGIKEYKYIDWFRDHRSTTISSSMRWSDAASWAATRTSRGSRSTIRSSARSRSAAGTASTRSANPPPALPRARGRALPQVDAVAGADSRRSSSSCTRRPTRWAATLARHGSSCRTPAGCRPTCRSGRSTARSCAAWSPRSRCPPAPSCVQGKRRIERGPARGQGLQAHGHFVLAGLQRHRRPGEGRMGRAGEEGRAHRSRRAAREGRRRARGRHAGLIFQEEG